MFQIFGRFEYKTAMTRMNQTPVKILILCLIRIGLGMIEFEKALLF